MRIFRGALPPSWPHAVYAIGNFDGLHLGHRAVIKRACALAQSHSLPAGLISFEPHPRTFFGDKDFVRIWPFRAKAELVRQMGLDVFVPLRFTRALAAMEAQDFIQDILLDALRARVLVCGANFRFGHKRRGDSALIKRQKGVIADIVEPVALAGSVLSSSEARRALAAGDMAQAAEILGFGWHIAGRVRHGDERGRQLGFPTANLALTPAHCAARFGVYAGHAKIESGRDKNTLWPAAINIGIRPSFASGAVLLEAHLLDFTGTLYGEKIRVFPSAFLRGEQKFASLAALSEQIRADIAAAKQVLRQQNASGLTKRLLLAPITLKP